MAQAGIGEMLIPSLPLNRKEVVFTAIVLPGIVCCTGFAHFDLFLQVLSLGGITIDTRPDTANIKFFTEYSVAESAAPTAVKAKFPSLHFTSKERPDVLTQLGRPAGIVTVTGVGGRSGRGGDLRREGATRPQLSRSLSRGDHQPRSSVQP
jgi:hypothetical protein